MTERDLAARRDRMTLRDRVTARRHLDQAAGVTYPPLSDEQAIDLAALMTG